VSAGAPAGGLGRAAGAVRDDYFVPVPDGVLVAPLEVVSVVVVVSEDERDELGGVEVTGGVDGTVDGDADGEVVPRRSLVLPDGDWLQALASVARSAKAHNPPSNFFMNLPPPESISVSGQQARCHGGCLTPMIAFSITGASAGQRRREVLTYRCHDIAPRTKETSG
jgi:hypothetical protein